MTYEQYKKFCGRPYIGGSWDCYGLVVDLYKDAFNIKLTDFARPDDWWEHEDLNLITDNLENDGWEFLDVNRRFLRPGDGFVMAVLQNKANHVGVYVGNGMMIHHQYKRFSEDTPFNDKWMGRTLHMVRHPDVEKFMAKHVVKKDMMDLLDPNIRRQMLKNADR